MVITTQGTWNYDQYVAPIKIVSPSTSQLSSPPPCNGPTSTASPPLSARRSGVHRLSPLANSVPTPTASPHAWATPADH